MTRMTDAEVEAWRDHIDAKREANRPLLAAESAERVRRFAPDAQAVQAANTVLHTVTCPTCGQARQVTKRRPGSECRSCGARAGRLRSLGRAS